MHFYHAVNLTLSSRPSNNIFHVLCHCAEAKLDSGLCNPGVSRLQALYITLHIEDTSDHAWSYRIWYYSQWCLENVKWRYEAKRKRRQSYAKKAQKVDVGSMIRVGLRRIKFISLRAIFKSSFSKDLGVLVFWLCSLSLLNRSQLETSDWHVSDIFHWDT